MTILTLAYDMRAPDFGASPRELYRAALDQCAWADQLGFRCVDFMEHHASSDGYLPSPIVMGSAAAARTQKILIRLSVLLLPLYHPLRAAEDLAILDIISNGRLRLTVGAGYRKEEYAQFGLEMRKRPSLMETGIDTLKKAWTGEPFEYAGRTVQIRPRPLQSPRPQIFMGGSSKASAERAARIADGYRPVSPELFEHHRRALAGLGKPEPDAPEERNALSFLHVSHDPDRDWKKIAPHALHENNSYGRWLRNEKFAAFRETDDVDQLRSSGLYRVVTPQECIALARRDGALNFKPLMGGLEPDLAWESLRLFEKEVLPHL